MSLYIPSNSRPRRRPALPQALLLWVALVKTVAAAPDVAPPHHAPPLMRPTAVVVNIHADIADTRFMLDLEDRLRKRLAPPILIRPATFDLSALRGLGKLDAQQLVARLTASIDWDQNRNVVHIFLIEDDMRLAPARFNFAASVGSAHTPHHVVVISLARLQETRLFNSAVDSNPARTATRVFKMIAKNTAKVAGYVSSHKCVFAFPHSLADLDAMPEGFCEPDASRLQRVGIARAVK